MAFRLAKAQTAKVSHLAALPNRDSTLHRDGRYCTTGLGRSAVFPSRLELNPELLVLMPGPPKAGHTVAVFLEKVRRFLHSAVHAGANLTNSSTEREQSPAMSRMLGRQSPPIDA